MSMAKLFATCQMGCHDVCDLLLVSMAKLREPDTRPGRHRRSQMRRDGRPLVERVLLTACTKSLCDLLARETAKAEALEAESRCYQGPISEAMDVCEETAVADKTASSATMSSIRESDSNSASSTASYVSTIDSVGVFRPRLRSLVLVTETFRPVTVSADSSEDIQQHRPSRQLLAMRKWPEKRGIFGRVRRPIMLSNNPCQRKLYAPSNSFLGRRFRWFRNN